MGILINVWLPRTVNVQHSVFESWLTCGSSAQLHAAFSVGIFIKVCDDFARYTRNLQRTAWNVAFHMKQIVGEITVNWDILRKSTWNLCKIHIYTPILYTLTVHGSHTLLQITCHFTQFVTKNIIKIPLENPCTWVTTLPTVKSVTNTFISWPEKTKKKRNINLWKLCLPQQLLWASCCWVGQGISCSFCAIAIHQHIAQHAQLTCSYRELHEMWHFIRWLRLLGKLLWIETFEGNLFQTCVDLVENTVL